VLVAAKTEHGYCLMGTVKAGIYIFNLVSKKEWNTPEEVIAGSYLNIKGTRFGPLPLPTSTGNLTRHISAWTVEIAGIEINCPVCGFEMKHEKNVVRFDHPAKVWFPTHNRYRCKCGVGLDLPARGKRP
jgi:hypothetical protein